jgi:hypothetical protein
MCTGVRHRKPLLGPAKDGLLGLGEMLIVSRPGLQNLPTSSKNHTHNKEHPRVNWRWYYYGRQAAQDSTRTIDYERSVAGDWPNPLASPAAKRFLHTRVA